MKTNELRQKYLDFFVSKGHSFQKSDVLVPSWDPTVLFTPAGMNQFKDHFLGNVELEFTTATTCQKCLRTGDIDNVGRTAYHHTFFEMLGNFSFGDYFKREAIQWAWEFLTEKKWLGLDPDRLTVTVYLDDDEAADIWQKDVGLSLDRIQRLDEYENFWPAGAPTDGPDGVCGPCSEIYYHPQGSKEVEIWNLVFTQFNRVGAPPDNLQPLPNKNIDTGMGLERIAAVMQGVDTNYHIDILRPLVEAAGEVCGIKYVPKDDNGRRLRRIADHVRACTFAIHENVKPGAEKEHYVIRRLLRRATLDGNQLGLDEPFLYQLVGKVAELMAVPYPELGETVDRVADTIRNEEQGFLRLIDAGKRRIEPLLQSLKAAGAKTIPGDQVAELYQTHGVPPEMVEALGLDEGLKFDWEGYKKAMEEHGDKSRTMTDQVMGSFGPLDQIKKEVKSTAFLGYEKLESPATVRGIVDRDSRLESINTDGSDQAILVLDRSPFYAESGGQVGDTGTITSDSGQFEVSDTQKEGDLIKHIGRMVQGEIKMQQQVVAAVATQRRQAIQRAHSATHILHHALQQTLGKHAQQQGSKVEPDLFRFDFANDSSVSYDALLKIESISNEKVKTAAPIRAEIIPMQQARDAGAMMLFGEKYPDPVRMVSMGDFSKELCGGTHLSNTSQVGLLEIKTEESVSSGTRRVVALTGEKANEFREQVAAECDQLADLLGTDTAGLAESTRQWIEYLRALKKQLASGTPAEIPPPSSNSKTTAQASYQEKRAALRDAARLLNVQLLESVNRVKSLQADATKTACEIAILAETKTVSADELISQADVHQGVTIVVNELVGGNTNSMRRLVDQIRQKHQPSAILLAAAQGDKVTLISGVTHDLVDRGISAGNWVKVIAPIVGGGGGGKPDLAQAGGKDPSKIGAALEQAVAEMKKMLG
jgi:alanyl-tRNA synthetase